MALGGIFDNWEDLRWFPAVKSFLGFFIVMVTLNISIHVLNLVEMNQ